MIVQYGQTPQTTPGVIVQVIPPQTNYLSPAETDILGIVGTSVWGPVNAPVTCGGYADFSGKFGPQQNRARDLGTAVAIATQQGSQNQVCVRVTDGTDTAASALVGVGTATSAVVAGGTGYTTSSVVTLSNGAVINVTTVTAGAITAFTVATQPTSEVTGAGAVTAVSASGGGTGATFTWTYAAGLGFTATSKYTGSGANGDTVILAAGNQVGTWKVSVFHAGLPVEVFNNLGLGLTGNALWVAIAGAINAGTAARGPSQIITAAAGTSTTAPVAETAVLAGGTDGASGVTDTSLVGADTLPPTGMYALRKTGASVGMLADCTTAATWPSQVALGLSEGVYMIGVGPAGDNITNAASTKSSAGVDSYAFKLLFGDWCYWLDAINNIQQRLVSPQAFVAGWIAANGPQQSSLNSPLNGIIATQKSASNTVYQTAELAQLETAGIDVIINPSPGGPYFAAAFGHNASSNGLIRGDNYTRLTNFIAATINEGLGPYIGQVQTAQVQAEAKTELDAYFNDLASATPPVISAADGSQPWLVVLDSSNNPPSQVALGRMQANVQVVYGSIIEQFLVNVEGGQSVRITTVSTTSAV